MSKLTIRFSEMDPQTHEVKEVEDTFSCLVEQNKISYQDNNLTNHEINFHEGELFISSNGDYEVSNHYINNQETEMKLVIKEDAPAYKLKIKTTIYEVSENNEEINVELKYSLFDDEGKISSHHIYMEVKK